jgi:hypothetical protein
MSPGRAGDWHARIAHFSVRWTEVHLASRGKVEDASDPYVWTKIAGRTAWESPTFGRPGAMHDAMAACPRSLAAAAAAVACSLSPFSDVSIAQWTGTPGTGLTAPAIASYLPALRRGEFWSPWRRAPLRALTRERTYADAVFFGRRLGFSGGRDKPVLPD